MTSQLTPRKRAGRPPTDGPIKQPISVTLDSRVAEGLRKYGDNNLSNGVGLAVAEATDRAGLAAALPDVRAVLAAPAPKAKTKLKGKTKSKRGEKAASRPLGRPIVGLAPRVRTNIQLYPQVVEQLRILGDGVVSAGIERAAVLVRAVRL